MRAQSTAALRGFVLVTRHGSFTRAAADMDVTASALSQNLRQLERQLGVRLLQRTTRRVGLTEAGRAFLSRITPALNAIDAAVDDARQQNERPAGTLRITCGPITPILRALPDFQAAWPEILLDVSVDTRLADVVADGYDAGIRLGECVDRDMVAVPLGGPERSVVVGAPAYFKRIVPPKQPRDLGSHNCARFRFATSGALYRWEFFDKRRRHWFAVAVDGNLIVNDNALMLAAARAGSALAHLPESMAATDIAEGRLVTVLDAWLPPYDGYYRYYPTRYQVPPKLRVFIDFMRDRFPSPAKRAKRST